MSGRFRGQLPSAKLFSSLCAGLLTLCVATPGFANGRFPSSQQLLVDPANEQRLWLRATYGVLTSTDAGKTWDWICEAGVGYSGRQDPMLGVTADSKVFVAASDGLFTTAVGGCSWHRVTDIPDYPFVDLALEADQEHVLGLALAPQVDSYHLVMFRSDERATNFKPVGDVLSHDLLGQTIDPAPSDASRIYVTGSVLPTSGAPTADEPPDVLLRSSDAGQSWQRLPIPGSSLSKPAFIAAVDPNDPDALYVRVRGQQKAAGVIESWLLYTDDAGDSWREIFRGNADMLGFSLSPDGKEVLVGMGDSHDPSGGRAVDPAALGIYRASTSDFAFSHEFDRQVGCLTRTPTGIFVCGSHDSEGFELGWSSDDGMTVAPLVDLGSIRGELKCNGESVLGCDGQWDQSCALLGKCSSSESDAGTDGGAVVPAKSDARSGGGCAIGSSQTGSRSALLVAACAVLLCGRRRRRNS